MNQLSDRQKKLLEIIIKEYVDSAQAVGSENLVEKYDLGVSPATIRSEMVNLTELSFLTKPHISSGRVPTDLGFRYYIKNIMQEEEIPVVNEVAIKERLWPTRHDVDALLRQVVQALADETRNLGLVLTDEGKLYSAGASHILQHPEFYDIDLTRTVLHLLDEAELVFSMFSKTPQDQRRGVFLGREISLETLSSCGVVFARLDLPRGQGGYLSVVGPCRLKYATVLPMVNYLADLVSELSKGW